MKSSFTAALFAAVVSATATRTDTYDVTWTTPFAGAKTGVLVKDIVYKAVYVQNSDKTVDLTYTATMNMASGKRIAASGDVAEVAACHLTGTANKYDCVVGALDSAKTTVYMEYYPA